MEEISHGWRRELQIWTRKHRNNPYGADRLTSEPKRVYVTEEQSKFLPMEHDKKCELLTWALETIF